MIHAQLRAMPRTLPISRTYFRSEIEPRFHKLALLRNAIPECLHAQGLPSAFGLLEQLPARGLAVVGTRHPLAGSIHRTRRWIHSLQGSGLVIVSGFAQGVDAHAHEAALEAGLSTVAVLGAGIDIDYPSGNADLRRRILEAGGLILSEYPPGTHPRPFHFPERNRLIAALSEAVIVIEARYRSGALNTAGWARRLKVPVFAVPSTPGDPAFSGNQRLIERGEPAEVNLFWGTRSLGTVWLELSSHEERMGGRGRRSGPASGLPEGLSEDDAALLMHLWNATRQNGGTGVESLVNWALGERQWTPERFFSVLQRVLSRKLVKDNGGFLTVELTG